MGEKKNPNTSQQALLLSGMEGVIDSIYSTTTKNIARYTFSWSHLKHFYSSNYEVLLMNA